MCYLFHVVKLLHVTYTVYCARAYIYYLIIKHIVSKNAYYNMLAVLDQNTMEYQIPF